VNYSVLAGRYRPAAIKVLLIGESPPEPKSMDIRQIPYFYNTKFVDNRRDSLLRETAKVILSQHVAIYSEQQKHKVLSELMAKGIFLIDAVEHPINNLKGLARKNAIRSNIPKLIRCIDALNPERIVVVLASVYDLICRPIQDAGLSIAQVRVPSPWSAKNLGNGYKDKLKEALSCPLKR